MKWTAVANGRQAVKACRQLRFLPTPKPNYAIAALLHCRGSQKSAAPDEGFIANKITYGVRLERLTLRTFQWESV